MRIVLRALPSATVLALLVLAPPAAAQTDGFVLHCLSAQAAGMGCVTRGQEGIPTTLFHDPAGIVAYKRPALEVNLTAFMPSLQFQNASNGLTDGALHAYPMGSVAYIGPKLTPRLAWAVGMEPIGGFGSDFRLDNPVLGNGRSYESFFAALKAGPVVAYELAPGFSVGASASLVYAQIRDFRMPFSMPASQAAGMAALAQLDPHYPALFAGMSELTAYGDSKGFAGTALTGDIGISWKATPTLRISASWSPKTRVSLSGGTATMDMSAQFNAMFQAMVQERMMNHGESAAQAQATIAGMLGSAGLNLGRANPAVGNYAAKTAITLPQTVGVGATFRPTPQWTLALEGGWMGWKAAEATMPFDLSGGDNPNLNILINANPAAASFNYPFPLQWKDSWIVKAGVERALGRGAVRAGWAYGSNPVPADAIFVTFPAIVEHSGTLGATLPLARLPLDVSVVRAFTKSVVGSTPSMIGSEYQASTTWLKETVVTVGTVVHF